MLAFRKALGVLVSLIALVGLLVTVILATRRIDQRPRTDDAYLQADLVHLAPDVSGRIVELDVRDNQAVRKGDVVFRIDPEPYRMRVDQARAAVRGLEAKLALTADQVAAQTSKAGAAERGIGSAEAQRALASSTLGRLQPLLGQGFVTAQQVDQARTAQRTAQIALQQAQLQAAEARQAITNTKPTEAELEGARATLALAERDLNKTVVRAPCDGRITALDIAAGEFAATGHPLFTIIATEHWYAIGNFRETDLAGMAPGQRATVYVMAQPSRALRGQVVVLLALVAIMETFRISEIALSGYIVLFLSGREAASTVLTALLAGIAVILAIFVTIAVFMLSLSEPALRIPLMAAMTFVAMFLSRTATPGPVFFVAGFIVAYGLTLGDQVLGLALQPATAGNAEQFALPEIVFAPPEEALVRFLLWLSLAVALPVILLIVANLLTGRDPARLLYQALAERLAPAARFCAGESRAERRLEAQAFEGTAELHKLHHLAGLMHRGRHRPVWGASLIDHIGRLGLLLLAWLRVEGDNRQRLVPAASACRRAEQAV